MKKDKVIIRLIILVFFTILFFNLFVLNIFENKYILAIFLLLFFLITKKYLGIKPVYNKNKNSVTLIIVVLGIVYLLALYIIGIYVGFYKNLWDFGITTLKTKIIPYSAIIILSELIRSIFIRREDKKIKIIITISLIFIDIITNIQLYSIFKLDSLLALIGNVILASISTNLLCNYTNRKYGCIPGICYRIITTMYIYIFSILPDIYTLFESVIKIIYPYIIFLIIDFAFEEDNFKKLRNRDKTSFWALTSTIIITMIIILLVSCKFTYGIMVVASGSMTGSLDKGDAVIFQQYNNQTIKEGTIVIFKSESRNIIHRVIDIQQLNGETIYYTKGDANQQKDDGYRTKQDIKAIVKFKIIEIGWPAIFINNLFKG